MLHARWTIFGIGFVAIVLVGALGWTVYQRTRPPAPDLSLERVRQARELVIGLDPSYPPFEVVNGQGQLDGFDVDLSRALAAGLGVKARFVAVDFGSIYDALEQHQFDVMLGGVTPTSDYLTMLNFSVPYYDDGLVLVLNQKAPGNVVGIENGSDADVDLDQIQPDLAGYQIQRFDDQDQIHDLLVRAQIKGTIVDAATGEIWSREIAGVVVHPTRLTPNPYVIAARRDDAALLRAIDQELTGFQRSGYIAGLDAKWLK